MPKLGAAGKRYDSKLLIPPVGLGLERRNDKKNDTNILGLPSHVAVWLRRVTAGTIMQAMHQSSQAPPESALPAQATASSAETHRPIGRVWIVVGIVALALGLAMGLIMSTVSS